QAATLLHDIRAVCAPGNELDREQRTQQVVCLPADGLRETGNGPDWRGEGSHVDDSALVIAGSACLLGWVAQQGDVLARLVDHSPDRLRFLQISRADQLERRIVRAGDADELYQGELQIILLGATENKS